MRYDPLLVKHFGAPINPTDPVSGFEQYLELDHNTDIRHELARFGALGGSALCEGLIVVTGAYDTFSVPRVAIIAGLASLTADTLQRVAQNISESNEARKIDTRAQTISDFMTPGL